MSDQRVFVSSVMRGYKDRRQAAREAITEVGMTPIMAEDMMAMSGAPREVVLVEGILDCDVVVSIYGNRYGWPGTRSGLSPTEEEYDRARELWKPIYAFVDRMQAGEPEPEQRRFLEKVQHWDVGLMRNEFRSLGELKKKIKRALTQADLSPRYRAFLNQVRFHARRESYGEIWATRVPAFDTVLHKEPSRNPPGPHMLIAVLDGDQYDRQQITHVASLWKAALAERFQAGFWRATSANGVIVIAVEGNPFGLRPELLREEYTWGKGRLDELLVDLVEGEVQYPPKPGWKKPWAPPATKGLLEAALSEL